MKNILEEFVKSTIIYILTKLIKLCREPQEVIEADHNAEEEDSPGPL